MAVKLFMVGCFPLSVVISSPVSLDHFGFFNRLISPVTLDHFGFFNRLISLLLRTFMQAILFA